MFCKKLSNNIRQTLYTTVNGNCQVTNLKLTITSTNPTAGQMFVCKTTWYAISEIDDWGSEVI